MTHTAPSMIGAGLISYVARQLDRPAPIKDTPGGGATWRPHSLVTGQSSKAAPALALIGGEIVLVYVANNATNRLLVTRTDVLLWLVDPDAGR